MHSCSFFQFFSLSCFFWPPILRGCLVGLFSPWMFFLVRCLFPGGVLEPVSCGLLFASACSVCPLCVRCFWVCMLSLWCLHGGAGSCWPLVVVVVSSSVVFARLCFGCVGLLRLGSLSPGFVPPLSCPPPQLVLWCLLVQSVFCLSLPLGIWLYLQRPGCHACGMVCCDGLAPVFTSPHGNKGFGPVWGFALYTMLRVLFWCPSFLH